MVDRDRDEFGKARNSRPRDALGRPLPHGSRGVARIPDDLVLSPADSLTYAQELLDQERLQRRPRLRSSPAWILSQSPKL